jgi:hypothetical protein
MELIRTISYSQDEILDGIITIHCSNGFECDITYGYGGFYKKIKEPRYKFDIDPKKEDVVQANSENIPLQSNSVDSVMFDPPFVVGPSKSPGIMRDRFGCYKNVSELWDFYNKTVVEAQRILRPNGIMVFKCQDTVSGGVNWFSHVAISNMAVKAGMYPKDLFLLLAKQRVNSPNMINQQHARKYHSYFWVIENRESRVNYESYLEGHKAV